MLMKISGVNEFTSAKDDDKLGRLLQENQTRGNSKNDDDSI